MGEVRGDAPPPRSTPPRPRQAAQTLLTTIAIQVVGLATGVVIARLLGVEGRGELTTIVLWSLAVAQLGDLGLPLATAYQAARDGRRVHALVANAVVLTAGQWVVLAALGSLAINLALGGGHDRRLVTMALLFLLCHLPLYLLERYLTAVTQGTGDFRWFNLIRLSTPVGQGAGLLALVVLDNVTVAAVAASILGANLLAAAVAVLACRRLLRRSGRPRPRPDLALARESIAYGVRGHLGNLTPVDTMRLDLLVVTAVLGTVDAGLYSVAASAAVIVRTHATALGMVVMPAVAAGRDRAGQHQVLASFTRLTLLLSVAAAVVVWVFARPLVAAVYGQAFVPAIPALRILVLGIVAASLRQVVGDGLRGLGKPLGATVSEMASWVVGAAALVVLVPLAGLTGAALAVSLSYVAALALVLGFARRAGLSLRELLAVRPGDLAGLRRLVRPNPRTSVAPPVAARPGAGG
jgi:enterobacterial common antigen flippase